MKYYKHYKNKPYKLLNFGKHTESQEDVVIYETLYENEAGRIWVRPKKMFFEKIELNNELVPRFQEIPLELNSTTEVTDAEIKILAPMIETVFGEWDPIWFNSRLNNHQKFYLVMGFMEGRPVGFKLGYEHDKWEFYSWLGAVLPDYRGFGVATELMRAQHEWCKQQGYRKVQTKSQNRFRAMLQLNIKSGFNIIGTQASTDEGMKIVLEKVL